MSLIFVSALAPNADPFYRALAACLADRIGVPISTEEAQPWWERERMLYGGAAHLGGICGLPYALRVDGGDPELELLAAPVPAAGRYRSRPVYFSDVVVLEESAVRSFRDLRGASWAYNEPGSHSGYNLTRSHLARLGERSGYFGRVVEAGSHQSALAMVLAGEVDASSIDSTVLETEIRLSPHLAERIRVIETLGPSPIPPLLVSTRLTPGVRVRMREALLALHHEPDGREVLRSAAIARFVPVRDRDYDPIRRMARAAHGIPLLRDSALDPARALASACA